SSKTKYIFTIWIGVHSCPGNELAKLEMFVVVYHLVTKFRWEVVESEGGIECDPFTIPQHGLPARKGKMPLFALILILSSFSIKKVVPVIAIKFRGVEADINFNLNDYEDDLKQF
ncbi:abscisic acid 8'-hydroxylase 4-like, partial [Thalictrum thalictroides]